MSPQFKHKEYWRADYIPNAKWRCRILHWRNKKKALPVARQRRKFIRVDGRNDHPHDLN